MIQSHHPLHHSADLLSPVFGGSFGETGSLKMPEDGGFMGALGTQLQDILIEWGEDPAEIAALDGQSLLAQFLALAQDRLPPADGPRIAVDKTPASLRAAVSSPLETPTDLLNKLLESSLSGTLPATVQVVPELSDGRAEDSWQAAPSSALPAESRRSGLPSPVGGEARPPPVAVRPPPLASEAVTPSSALPAESRRSGLPSPVGGGARPPPVAVRPPPLASEAVTPSSAPPAESRRSGLPSPVGGVESAAPTAALADSGESDGESGQALTSRATAPAWLSQFLQGRADAGFAAGRSASLLTGEGQGLPAVFSTRGALLDLEIKATDDTERLAVRSASNAAAELPETGLPATGATSTGTQIGSGPARILDLSNLLRPGGETHLAEQVKWVMRSGLGTAELTLHPPSLGAMDVRVTMEDDKAHVQFLSPHPIVREVLEAALPRLRDTLAQDGLSLGTVSISDQSTEGRRESGHEQTEAMQNRQYFDEREGDEVEVSELMGSTLSALSRRLDYFV